MTAAVADAHLQDPQPGRSPLAGADICRQAGLALPAGAARPGFDDDLWDFTDVIGLPVSLALAVRRFSFTQIADPRWRLVAKELIFATLVPRHEAVAELPRAFRTPMHLTTASGRLQEISRCLNWLAGQGIPALGEVCTHHCEAYLAHRCYVRDEHGTVIGERSPGAFLFGRIAFSVRYAWFRDWVNGPSGQRLGLEPVPDYPVSLRALRRTLAIELAYCPDGVLAAKVHLKHVAVATTEGVIHTH